MINSAKGKVTYLRCVQLRENFGASRPAVVVIDSDVPLRRGLNVVCTEDGCPIIGKCSGIGRVVLVEDIIPPLQPELTGAGCMKPLFRIRVERE